MAKTIFRGAGFWCALSAVAWLGSALVACGGSDRSTLFDEARVAAIEAEVQATMEELGVIGVVVRIERGADVWTQAFGVSDLEEQAPLGTSDLWPLRSITKSFTVTLLLQLVDEGLVDLDDRLGDHLPGVAADDDVTLRQLAGMMSGLPDYTNEAWITDFLEDPSRWFTVDELIAYAADDPMRFEPGTERAYNNLNTLLLGRVVEETLGAPFDEALEDRILARLQLDRALYPAAPEDVTLRVTGYEPDAELGGALDEAPVNFSVFGPAGAMLAPLDELAAWGAALARGELLDPETQRARLTGGPLAAGPEYDLYALGIGSLEGWWGHTGEGFGFTSLVMHELETDTTVVIVCNAAQLDTHLPTALFRELVPILR